MRILITGSRDWTDPQPILAAILAVVRDHGEGRGYDRRPVLVHGGARGADTIAAGIAHRLGFDVEAHPANWSRYGKSAGHRRNAEMVAAGADVCLAFPLGPSRGTRGCMKAAADAGIPVRNLDPDSGRH